MEYLNQERTLQLWDGIKAALSKKQDELTGTSGQIVGFDVSGKPAAYATAVPGGVATLDARGVLAPAQRPNLAEIEGGSRCNLLDNWYFAAPINQRGQTVYTEPGYTIDRWRLNASIKLSLLDGFIRLERTNTEEQPLCYQPVAQEESACYSGKTLTFSILYRTNSDLFSFAIEDSRLHTLPIPSASEFTSISITVTLDGALNYVGLKLNTPMESITNEYIDLIAAKLELGTNQTLVKIKEGKIWSLNDAPPNQSLELEKCQRYQSNINNGLSERFCVGIGNAITSTLVLIDIPLPTSLRARPYISFSGEWYVIPDTVYTWGSGLSLPVKDITSNQLSNNFVTVNVAVKDAVLGQRYRLVCIHAKGKDSLLLDANL